MTKIGFIGLGIMGSSMCRNLLTAGFEVTAYNRTLAKTVALEKYGAKITETPAQAAANADFIITIVSDSPDVEQVILGENGVVYGAKPGSVVIDMSTISPSVTRMISEKLHAKNIHMIDAPVSGGDSGAKAGTLAIMAGGDADIFNRCLPIFQAMGKSITHVGANGMGQTVKLCNQILVSVTNMAVCESVLFAQRAGVDPNIMIEAVKGGAAGSWQLSNLAPKMTARDFAPGFMIDLQQKDLRLALETARETLTPLPALSLVYQLFTGSQAHMEGREGTQALIKSLERLAGEK